MGRALGKPVKPHNWVHVIPLNDLRPHDECGLDCLCGPRFDDGIVIHNSWDGREITERALDSVEAERN